MYALVAVGFGLILHTTRTFHIAHGAVYTAAGFACYLFLQCLTTSLVLSILAAVIVASVLGVMIECLVYHPLRTSRGDLRTSSHILMISSLGVYVVITNVLALFFGSEAKLLRPGVEGTISLAGVIVTYIQLGQFVVGLLTIATLGGILSATKYGRLLRAFADDPTLIEIVGYRVRLLRVVVLALGSALAGIAGILHSLDVGIEPYTGMSIVLVASVAVILGGRRSLLSPALGAVILGLLQSVITYVLSDKWSVAVVYAILVAALVVKPRGLLDIERRIGEE